MNPDERLNRLDALDAEARRRRRRAVWTSSGLVLAAAAISGALLYLMTTRLTETYGDLARVEENKKTVEGELEVRRAEVLRAEQELQEKQALLRILEKKISEKELMAAAAQAQQSVQAGSQVSGQKLRARAYLQIGDVRDRPYVESIAAQLRLANFIVPGIEYVAAAATLRRTNVRYYKKSDRLEAERLVAVLLKAGVSAIERVPQYLSQYENSNSVRPNHLEVWFAPVR